MDSTIPSVSSSTNFTGEFGGCKVTKIVKNDAAVTPPVITKHPEQVKRRNARERKRVQNVNQGFVVLRNHVPAPNAKSKKLSKVETLRAATNYIQQLRQMLTAGCSEAANYGSSGHSMTSGHFFGNMLGGYSGGPMEQHSPPQFMNNNSPYSIPSNNGTSPSALEISSNYYQQQNSNYVPQVTYVNGAGDYSKVAYKTAAQHNSNYDYVLSPPEIKQYNNNSDYQIMHSYS